MTHSIKEAPKNSGHFSLKKSIKFCAKTDLHLTSMMLPKILIFVRFRPLKRLKNYWFLLPYLNSTNKQTNKMGTSDRHFLKPNTNSMRRKWELRSLRIQRLSSGKIFHFLVEDWLILVAKMTFTLFCQRVEKTAFLWEAA